MVEGGSSMSVSAQDIYNSQDHRNYEFEAESAAYASANES